MRTAHISTTTLSYKKMANLGYSPKMDACRVSFVALKTFRSACKGAPCVQIPQTEVRLGRSRRADGVCPARLISSTQAEDPQPAAPVSDEPVVGPGPSHPAGQPQEAGPHCAGRECARLHERARHEDSAEFVHSMDYNYVDASAAATATPCYNTLRGPYYIVNVYAWVAPFVDSAGVSRGNGNRSSSQLSVIRDKLKRADYVLDQSASNWDQHWRLQCDAANQPKVEILQVDPCAEGGQSCGDLRSGDVRAAAYAAGHTNRNYIYFYWLDSSIAELPGYSCWGGNGICPAENNVNSGYAVRMPYIGNPDTAWKGRNFVHEAMHALDAVKSTAPHATGAPGHCADGHHPAHEADQTHRHHDVMCYNDGGETYLSRRLATCSTEPIWWVDCNKDDYWKPSGGTYMADINGSLTVFNTAKSIWLSSLCSEATQEEPLTCQRNDGRIN